MKSGLGPKVPKSFVWSWRTVGSGRKLRPRPRKLVENCWWTILSQPKSNHVESPFALLNISIKTPRGGPQFFVYSKFSRFSHSSSFFANQISKIIVFPYNLALAGRNRNYVFWEILATKNDSKLNKNQEGLNWRVYSYMNYLKTHIINAYTQSYQCKISSWTHLRMKDYTCKVMIVWWNTWRYVDNHVSACAMEVCKSWRGYSFTNQTMYWLQPRIKQF